jgi:hypothetical protein
LLPSGINNYYADNGLSDQFTTRLYFPADQGQMRACVDKVFWDEGLRFVFSTRSKLPQILGPDGKELYGKGCRPSPHHFIEHYDSITQHLEASSALTHRIAQG